MNAQRRGSSALVAIVIVLVVAALLVGGLVFADRYVRGRVEDSAATQLQTDLGTPTRPELSIEGFPFLTQVAAQSIRSVHLVADQVGQNIESSVVVAHVDLYLTDVVSQDRFATMTVSHAEGTALLDYAEVQSLSALPLVYVGGGRFRVDTSTTVLGQQVTAQVTGGLTLNSSDQTVTLSDPTVKVGDVTLPQVAADALISALVKPIPLTGIPFGLRLTSIDPQDDGLHAGVVGDNIPVTR
jgi:hypothetical protein